MIQDILVQGIVWAAVARTLLSMVVFLKPDKGEKRRICSGCNECPVKQIHKETAF